MANASNDIIFLCNIPLNGKTWHMAQSKNVYLYD